MAQAYYNHVEVEDGMVECPRAGTLPAKRCRQACRYYYGRGIIKFVENFNPNEKRVPGEPQEYEKARWHICNYPETV
jgi:hypothetical protein